MANHKLIVKALFNGIALVEEQYEFFSACLKGVDL